jgi:hypothetical protein
MTNVEAAATAIQADSNKGTHWSTYQSYARAALDAIDRKKRLADRTPELIEHLLDLVDADPRLALLTPGDITVILNIVHAALTVDMPPGWSWTFPQHVYEVLTR